VLSARLDGYYGRLRLRGCAPGSSPLPWHSPWRTGLGSPSAPPALQFPAVGHDTKFTAQPPVPARAASPGTCSALPQVPCGGRPDHSRSRPGGRGDPHAADEKWPVPDTAPPGPRASASSTPPARP